MTPSHLLTPETEIYVWVFLFLILRIYHCTFVCMAFSFLVCTKKRSLTLGLLSKTGTATPHFLVFASLSSYREHNSPSVPKSFCKWASFLLVLAPYRDQHHQCNSVTPEVRLCSCLNSAWPVTTRQCEAGSNEGFYF